MVEAWTSRQKKPGIFRQPPEIATPSRQYSPRFTGSRDRPRNRQRSGEHAYHFSELFPHLTWQPSDPDPLNLDSILAWVNAAVAQSSPAIVD